MEFTYKEMRAFSVDFAYYIHLEKLGDCSSEKHKELFDEWVKNKLPNENKMGNSKRMMISRYDETIKEPPYSTIQIDKTLIEKPDVDNLGEEFYNRIYNQCSKLGYRVKFYTISTHPDFDYEIVVE
jgi:hypothetical protein